MEGLVRAATRSDLPVQINRLGSMLTLFFSEEPVRQFAKASASRRDQFAAWALGLRKRGILIPPSPLEAIFLAAAHTEAQVDRCVDAARAAFRAIRRR